MSLQQITPNATIVTQGQTKLFYSYQTLIAIQTQNFAVRLSNTFSRTTGKHFNKLGCENFTIVTKAEFAEIERAL